MNHSGVNRSGVNRSDANRSGVLVGFDPGRDKCGLAVMTWDRTLISHDVVPSEGAIATLQTLQQQFQIDRLILGDQTTSQLWKSRIEQTMTSLPPIELVDERYTTLEARDRYWLMFPPRRLMRLLPQGLRQPPRPIDDIVAILLVERYLIFLLREAQLET